METWDDGARRLLTLKTSRRRLGGQPSTRGWSLGIDPTASTATHSSFITRCCLHVYKCVCERKATAGTCRGGGAGQRPATACVAASVGLSERTRAYSSIKTAVRVTDDNRASLCRVPIGSRPHKAIADQLCQQVTAAMGLDSPSTFPTTQFPILPIPMLHSGTLMCRDRARFVILIGSFKYNKTSRDRR